METTALASAHGTTKILADCLLLTGGHTTFDLYDLVGDLLQNGSPSPIIMKAVVLAKHPDAAQNVQFRENLCVNRSFIVRTFSNREEAQLWLTA